jgi:hypothetical protein
LFFEIFATIAPRTRLALVLFTLSLGYTMSASSRVSSAGQPSERRASKRSLQSIEKTDHRTTPGTAKIRALKKSNKEGEAGSAEYTKFVAWMREHGFEWDDDELDLRCTGRDPGLETSFSCCTCFACVKILFKHVQSTYAELSDTICHLCTHEKYTFTWGHSCIALKMQMQTCK